MSAATDALVDEIMSVAVFTAMLDSIYDQLTEAERTIARIGMLSAIAATFQVLDERGVLSLEALQ